MKRLLLLIILVVVVAALLMWLWRRVTGVRERKPDKPRWVGGSPDWLLLVLPLPVVAAVLISLIRGEIALLLGNSLGCALLLGGALIVRRTKGNGVPRAVRGSFWSRWPPKPVGAGLLTLGSGVTAWLGAGHHPLIAAFFGLATLLGFHLVYGLGLRVQRPSLGVGGHGMESLHRAERSIAAIERSSQEIPQAELNARLTRIAALARQILQRVKDDPRDLWRARKFLNVYLDGVQRIVEGYAKTHAQVAAPQLDQRFRYALETVEAAFREQQQILLDRDVEDLDVQIEVLTKQLEREGIL